jgi:ABC-2 type transport system ATP-binding protein
MVKAPVIFSKKLVKEFKIPVQKKLFERFPKHFFNRDYTFFRAVNEIDISIMPGERVAFIGPNGAGKSTTIKMLTGIIQPTSGEVTVCGMIPSRDRKKLSYKLGCVMGQRSQLWYHLTAEDSFRILGKMYRLDKKAYISKIEELHAVFGIGDLLGKKIASMSLGQRMKCELTASLLHTPEVLLLDEPSIGLDIISKALLREFIRDFSKNTGTTVLLTSHDIGDIEEVCDRVVMINKGKILHNCSLEELKVNYLQKKNVTLTIKSKGGSFTAKGISLLNENKNEIVFEVDTKFISIEDAVKTLFHYHEVLDIAIENTPLEKIIASLY